MLFEGMVVESAEPIIQLVQVDNTGILLRAGEMAKFFIDQNTWPIKTGQRVKVYVEVCD
jgi:hypothetical protein